MVILHLNWSLHKKSWIILFIQSHAAVLLVISLTLHGIQLSLCKDGLTHWHSERPKQAWLFCWYFPHISVFIKNIWRRNVYQNITNNSPSNILWEFALFPSYFQKYENSRRYFPANRLRYWVKKLKITIAPGITNSTATGRYLHIFWGVWLFFTSSFNILTDPLTRKVVACFSFRVIPLTLRSAKRGLTILEIFYLQKHFS